MTCSVCGNTHQNRSFEAREMMFGTGDRFRYLDCGACGCVQLLDVPADLSPFYPSDYYSFSPIAAYSAPKRALKLLRDRYALTGRGWVGRWLYQLMPDVAVQSLAPLGLHPDAALLDVGCGQGHLLRSLHGLGFRNLLGIDPYVASDQTLGEGFRILKKNLSDTPGTFDVVMLHHVFEHLGQPLETLRDVARLLKPGGTALLRIPVADSWAYRHYGPDWFNLDAPRHLFLYTRRSLERLAQQAGLRVESVHCDALPTQFWGSEQYRRGIPLMAPESYLHRKKDGPFTHAQLRDFQRRTTTLNAEQNGDQACFYLKIA